MEQYKSYEEPSQVFQHSMEAQENMLFLLANAWTFLTENFGK